MSGLDWGVFAAFLFYVIWDGLRRARKTKTLEGYFAGGRSIPWWAAGLSVMATQASAITVIGTTGKGHDGGMEFVQTYFGLPFAMVLLCIFLVPLYRKSPILTAYEYLERRLGPGTRSLASLLFLVSRCLAFGLVIYAPAVVLAQMLSVPMEATVIFVGALTTLYTMVGGVHAVIWTDVKQMVVILAGLLLCLGILLVELLSEFSFGEMCAVLGATGKLNPLEVVPESTSFVPRTAWAEGGTKSFWEEKYNLWSGLFGGLFLHLSYFGCDQSQVQRILTNPTERESRMALLMSAFAKVPMQLMVLFIGVLLYLFYTVSGSPLFFSENERDAAVAVPEVQRIQAEYDAVGARRLELARTIAAQGDARQDPEVLRAFQVSVQESERLRGEALQALGRKPSEDKDYIFPHFIFGNLPPILLGLIVAAIFAAAMSSSDSALNSLTSASVVDFYRRWIRPEATEQQSLVVSRVITLFWGAAATGAALWLGGSGPVIELINKVGSFFYGSLLGVFVVALLIPRAGPRAGFLGLVGGMASVLVVHNTLRVEFLWYNVIGCVGVVLTAAVVVFAGLERRR